MKNILIIDPICKTAVEELKLEFNVDYNVNLKREELINKIEKYSILIVRSGHKIDYEIIEKAKNLKLLIRAGSGFDNIDINALNNKNIDYCNIPAVNSLAVSELVISYIFALSRDLVYTSNLTKQNIWIKDKYMGYQVEGKTLGIIGYGNIGQCIAKKANALGMKVFASVKNMNNYKKEVALKNKVELTDNENIYKISDYICVCIPLNNENNNLITIREFKKMKSSCSFINISRGLVINENDLYEALKKGIIKNAAVDVFSKEKSKSKLFELDNVICTPHIGAMTYETQEKIGKIVVEKIYKYEREGILND